MYERQCILILAHNARVPAARHTRLTRSTGPTSIPVQIRMRATHFARVLSQLAHRTQLANLHMRICAWRHSSTTSTSEMRKHLEALARQTPFAGWHAEQMRWQWPMPSLTQPQSSTHPATRIAARPPFVTARTSRVPPLHGLEVACAAAQLLRRGKSACRSGLAQQVRDGCNSLAVRKGQLEPPATRRGP